MGRRSKKKIEKITGNERGRLKGIHKGQTERVVSKTQRRNSPKEEADLVGRRSEETGVWSEGEETGDQEKEGTRETSRKELGKEEAWRTGRREAGRGAGGEGRWALGAGDRKGAGQTTVSCHLDCA